MPNVEIHTVDNTLLPAGETIREEILKIFANWSCAGDMITDIIMSDPRDLKGTEQPYLRVYDTNEEEGKKIAWRLQLEGFDVELIKLNKFLPKPMYSIGEIEEELRILTNVGGVSCAMALLRSGAPLDVIGILGYGLTKKYANESAPTTEELSQRFVYDPTANACRGQFIRWTQMRNLFCGK
jgi:hypothetical protein